MATETKKNKAVYWVLGIGLVAAIVYAVYKYTSLPTLIKDTLNPKYNAGGDFIVDYGDEINTSKVMTLGDKGNNVTRLQTEVNKWITDHKPTQVVGGVVGIMPIQKLSVDGIYGPKTEAAIIAISGGTLHSGNVTVNKIANLMYSLPGSTPAPTPTTVTNPPPLVAAATTTSGLKTKFDAYIN